MWSLSFASCENIISDLQYILVLELCQFYSVTLNKIYFSQYVSCYVFRHFLIQVFFCKYVF